MKTIWLMWDQKCSDPILFETIDIALDYAKKWIKTVIHNTDIREYKYHDNSVEFFVGPLRLLKIVPSKLYFSIDELKLRTDYPRLNNSLY